MFLYILADLISFLEIQRLRLAGSSSTVFAVNLILLLLCPKALFLDRPLVFKSVLQVLKESLGILLVSMKNDPRQNSWFELQHLNFTAEFKILHFFSSLENNFTLTLLNSTFLFDLARCTFSTSYVQSHTSQTMQFSTRRTNFIHCFFLLLLMPEPVLYI